MKTIMIQCNWYCPKCKTKGGITHEIREDIRTVIEDVTYSHTHLSPMCDNPTGNIQINLNKKDKYYEDS